MPKAIPIRYTCMRARSLRQPPGLWTEGFAPADTQIGGRLGSGMGRASDRLPLHGAGGCGMGRGAGDSGCIRGFVEGRGRP